MIPDDTRLLALAREVGAWLVAREVTLATAESCTAGWVAKALTDVAGSGDWFLGGVVSYADQVKTALLGVPADLLREQGAVSRPVVEAMARGVLERTGADLGVAISGIAGPSGGSEQKPVGTVWFAWGRRDGGEVSVVARRVQFEGDREAVRRQAVEHALAGVMAGYGA